MADIKISDVTIGSISEIVSGDYALFLDKSATSGPQSGPGGTLKLVPVSAFRRFGTVPITEYDLNLNGISTNQPLLDYIADAINSSGPFTNVPGGRMVFRTYSVSGIQTNYSVTITYFELKTGFDTFSVGGATGVTADDLVISGGPYIRNPEVNEDLFLDLGDIGAGPVEDAFNLGDGGDSWQIVGTKFITAELNGNPTVWKFVGTGYEYWGGVDAATDPETGTAVAADFLLLNEEAPVQGTKLSDLIDLNIPRDLISSPIADGSVLTYNATTEKWEAEVPSSGGVLYETFACSSEDDDLVTGAVFKMVLLRDLPDVSKVDFSVTTAPTGSTIILNVKKNATTIFSTKPTIDASEFSTLTASTPQVLDGSISFDAGDVLLVEIDQIGSTIAGKGLKAQITYNS